MNEALVGASASGNESIFLAQYVDESQLALLQGRQVRKGSAISSSIADPASPGSVGNEQENTPGAPCNVLWARGRLNAPKQRIIRW